MNPFEVKTKDLNDYFLSLDEMYPKAYDKNSTSPYTKTRVILMNGTEFESVWLMHQFARHCNVDEILETLSIIRKQEQQQQKLISCLKPIDESILETTIAYEQLAVDLTAFLAKHEKDTNNKNALDFALLEDFDHLYRFSNMLYMDQNIEAKDLVGKYTELTPGRPTIAEHRYPTQDLKDHMDAKKADLFSKLVGCIITAAEQQTMNYYMNIAQWYKNDLGRRVYAEIAMIEEAHVSQYESLKDPTMTWLEQWLMHEYTECYLYYSAKETESDKDIKAIWEKFYEMECCHLKTVANLLKKYEDKETSAVVGDGKFPKLLELGENKEYIRNILKDTITNNTCGKKYMDVCELGDDCMYCYYQNLVVKDETEPVHVLTEKVIKKFGQDYRYEDSKTPVKELQDRTCDNITIARCCKK